MCTYIAQHDSHHPTLTVKETLFYAYNLKGCEFCKDVLFEAGAQTDVCPMDGLPTRIGNLVHNFGLRHCFNTVVGNEAIKGISGGETRRLTTAEMLTGPFMCLLGDEISTGLDSAAVFDILSAMKRQTGNRKITPVIALQQPSQDAVELFDDICLLAGGRIIYHGPVNLAESYFSQLGFHRPPNVDFADFLVDLSTDDARLYWRKETPCPTHAALASEWEDGPLYAAYIKPRFAAARKATGSPSDRTQV